MSHPQLEKLADIIGGALAAIGICDTSWDQDCQVAKVILEAGFVIPQVTLPTPVLPRKDAHSEARSQASVAWGNGKDAYLFNVLKRPPF